MPSKNNIKLGVISDPIERLNVKKDSTIAMLEAAAEKGWEIFFMEQKDLNILNGKPAAKMRLLKMDLKKSPWFKLDEPCEKPLSDLNIILMRFGFMRCYRHGNEHQRQTAEDKCLDKTDQQLQPVERQSQTQGHQENGDKQQYLTGRHVAEETKSKADDTDKHAEQFQQADEGVYHSGEQTGHAGFDPAPE